MSNHTNLFKVLRRAWSNPFSTKSDFARLQADTIAMAASDGFITNKVATGIYRREWLITEAGLKHLRRLEG